MSTDAIEWRLILVVVVGLVTPCCFLFLLVRMRRRKKHLTQEREQPRTGPLAGWPVLLKPSWCDADANADADADVVEFEAEIEVEFNSSAPTTHS
jgi:hypothetical protein